MVSNTLSVLYISMVAVAVLGTSCINVPEDPPNTEPTPHDWTCKITGDAPPYMTSYGCKADFDAMASAPRSEKIPGAITAKAVFDREDPLQRLWFINTKLFQVHFDFASKVLDTMDGLPPIRKLSEFNLTEYYKTNRRFILGAVTYYEEPNIWCYELSCIDNASVEMIKTAFNKIADSTYFGDSLYFHPLSTEQIEVAKNLPPSIRVITNEQIYEGIDYQPLNVSTSIGRLVFVKAAELDTAYVNFRNIVVLDIVPNDISVTCGIITEMFQTPLAHINVLSMNRKTPNMALRGAWNNTQLRSLENKWVKLDVELSGYTITEATVEEADGWWGQHKPGKVGISNMDTTVKALTDAKDILNSSLDLGLAIKKAIPAFGGKTTHFSSFPHMDSTKVPYPKEAFGIPVFYYWQHMEKNGLNAMVAEMLVNDNFKNIPAVRDKKLEILRDSIENAPLDSAFEELLFTKLNTKFAAGMQVRFRSSTNAEDLDGFTGAGLYISEGGTMGKPKSIRNAIRNVWASVWLFRAFEERSYRQIEHTSAGMALLVHRSFPDEEANGVAITGNIFDTSGNDPALYINVQYGDGSVVLPDAMVTSDEIFYYFDTRGKPIEYRGHSNVLPPGKTTVLTDAQIRTLGIALKEIHNYFKPTYGSNPEKRYAMETEFKFDQPLDNPDGEPVLLMKQCRPYYAD